MLSLLCFQIDITIVNNTILAVWSKKYSQEDLYTTRKYLMTGLMSTVFTFDGTIHYKKMVLRPRF